MASHCVTISVTKLCPKTGQLTNDHRYDLVAPCNLGQLSLKLATKEEARVKSQV
jgi:hypothetical protein